MGNINAVMFPAHKGATGQRPLPVARCLPYTWLLLPSTAGSLCPKQQAATLQQPRLLAMPQLETKSVSGSINSLTREQLRTLAGITTLPPEEEMQMGDRGVMALILVCFPPARRGSQSCEGWDRGPQALGGPLCWEARRAGLPHRWPPSSSKSSPHLARSRDGLRGHWPQTQHSEHKDKERSQRGAGEGRDSHKKAEGHNKTLVAEGGKSSCLGPPHRPPA